MNEGRRFYRVTVALTTKSFAGQRKLAGVFKFLSETNPWELTLLRSENELTSDFIHGTLETTDGFLVSLHESSEIRKALAASRKPIVFLDNIDIESVETNRDASFIVISEFAVGETAARHFLASGRFKSFAFIPAKGDPYWSRDRLAGFKKTLATKGESVRVYDTPDTESDKSELSNWIAGLPKPTAIFAAYDDRAIDVIDACRRISVRIPRDAMILGAGDDELICNGCKPTLSSVHIPFEQHGYIAARELQVKMTHPVSKKRILHNARTFTISRRQTTTGKVDIPALVQDGLAYIKAYATTGIKVPDVVKYLRVSRRLADLRFHEVTGQSILQIITEVQIEEAKRLLRATTLTVSEIASECGFSTANYFKNVFARNVGTSPRSWRTTR